MKAARVLQVVENYSTMTPGCCQMALVIPTSMECLVQKFLISETHLKLTQPYKKWKLQFLV